jgi:hypothetical protein
MLGQHRADEPQDRGAVGRDADDVAAPTQLAVETLLRIGRPDLPPVIAGEAMETSRLSGLTERRSLCPTA